MREGVSVKDSYLESVRRWCAYLYLRDIRYSIKKNRVRAVGVNSDSHELSPVYMH